MYLFLCASGFSTWANCWTNRQRNQRFIFIRSTWLRQLRHSCSLFATQAMAPELSTDAEGTWTSLSPQKFIIMHCDYPSLGHIFFIWPCNLRNDRTRSPPTLCPLPTSLLWSGFWIEKIFSLSCPVLGTQHTWKASTKQCTGAGCQNAIFLCWSLVF